MREKMNDCEAEGPSHPMAMENRCARESASASLRRLARDLRERAHDLEILADCTSHLPQPADAALWGLVHKFERA